MNIIFHSVSEPCDRFPPLYFAEVCTHGVKMVNMVGTVPGTILVCGCPRSFLLCWSQHLNRIILAELLWVLQKGVREGNNICTSSIFHSKGKYEHFPNLGTDCVLLLITYAHILPTYCFLKHFFLSYRAQDGLWLGVPDPCQAEECPNFVECLFTAGQLAGRREVLPPNGNFEAVLEIPPGDIITLGTLEAMNWHLDKLYDIEKKKS